MNKTRKTEKLADAKKELEQVNNAISSILSGAQGYKIGSRSVQRAELAILYKRKDSLDDLIDALEGGASSFRQIIPTG